MNAERAPGGETEQISLAFIEEDDFEDFEDREWDKDQMVEDASVLWDDRWQIPNDGFTEKLRQLLSQKRD
ncbi:hypothetical protein DIPPA_22961 [Diplonema papillatum]|nr:hypothetical protein DIPPA_22961 [Diplonema papillatum]